MGRVLVIGDCHMPAMHVGYIPFLKKIEKKYNCNRVVHIGDAVDWNAISFHEKDPALPSPEQEYKEAYKQMQRMFKAFPKVDYMTGNHSDLPARKARFIGLPDSVVMPFKKVWDAMYLDAAGGVDSKGNFINPFKELITLEEFKWHAGYKQAFNDLWSRGIRDIISSRNQILAQLKEEESLEALPMNPMEREPGEVPNL